MNEEFLSEGTFLSSLKGSFSGKICWGLNNLTPESILLKNDNGLIPSRFHNKIKGVICNIGGLSSHFVIHADEYGIFPIVLADRFYHIPKEGNLVVRLYFNDDDRVKAKIYKLEPPNIFNLNNDQTETKVNEVNWDRLKELISNTKKD